MEVDIIDLGAKYVFFEEEFDFVVHDSTEDLHDGHALVSDLEIPASAIVHKDRASTRTGRPQRQGVHKDKECA
jgi:hypothetical protein